MICLEDWSPVSLIMDPIKGALDDNQEQLLWEENQLANILMLCAKQTVYTGKWWSFRLHATIASTWALGI